MLTDVSSDGSGDSGKKQPANNGPVDEVEKENAEGSSNDETETTSEDIFSVNLEKVKDVPLQDIEDLMEQMDEVEATRAVCNAKAAGIRATVNALNIPTVSFNAAYARRKLDPKKRAAADPGYFICCKAADVEYQRELFGGSPD